MMKVIEAVGGFVVEIAGVALMLMSTFDHSANRWPMFTAGVLCAYLPRIAASVAK